MKEKEKAFDFKDMVDQTNEYLNITMDARALSEKCRDYADGKQWSVDEIAELKRRNQAPIVNNRIKTKLQGLLGLVIARKSDPKAYPRTAHEENSADAITDALRYVTDNNDFSMIKVDTSDNFFCEGYGGAIVDVRKNGNGENDIAIDHIPWDRIYFDPYSRRRDFKDAKYMGIMIWMDEEDIEEQFPDVDVNTLIPGHTIDDTFEDRPRWFTREHGRRRFRVAQHFYRYDGSWYMCFFTETGFLQDPIESPYLDEFGNPTNPIELVGAYIDRDNNRYGEVASFLDLQDEINHRRSKALHLLSRRQTASRQGAVKDIASMKREMAKPDGHVEYQGEKGDFEVLQTGDMANGQFELLKEAKAEIDAQSYNAQLAGQRQSGDLSGSAINKLQQAGVIELNNLFAALNNWELRIYRQIWSRIKQFWTEEKWIRITDDQDTLRWIGLNAQVTAQQYLEEQINDKSLPDEVRKSAAATYTFLMQSQDPILQTTVDIRNNVPELDVDIILDMSFDVVNIQQEQFQLLTQFAGSGDVDIVDLIEISQLRDKKSIVERIEKRRQERAAAQSSAEQAQMQHEMIKAQKTMSETALNQEQAQQKQVETIILANTPIDKQPQVSV